MSFRNLAEYVTNEMRTRGSLILDEAQIRTAIRDPNFNVTTENCNRLAAELVQTHHHLFATVETYLAETTRLSVVFIIIALSMVDYGNARRELQRMVESKYNAEILKPEIVRTHEQH